jgi:hypothetical protein
MNYRGPGPHVLWAADYDLTNLDTTHFPPAANDWRTNYFIPDTTPPHLAKGGGGDRHLKGTKPGHDLYRSFFPTSIVTDGKDLSTCQPHLTPPCVPAQHAPVPPRVSDPRRGTRDPASLDIIVI